MFVQVDVSKCNKDGLCVLECPARILEMHDNGPVAIEGAEEICIQCGHCVAICPEAALSLDFLTPDECMDIDEKLSLTGDHVEHFLKSRRSIRTYRKKPVSADLLEKALSIASCAPTGSNKQSVRWFVIHKREDVQSVGSHVIDWMRFVITEHPDIAANFNMPRLVNAWEEGLDRICRDAPHLIFSYALKENSSGKADCDTALAYLELTLPSLGLGSCWAGYVTAAANQWPPLKQFLGLEDSNVIHGAVMAGFPKFTYKRIPRRNNPDITYLR